MKSKSSDGAQKYWFPLRRLTPRHLSRKSTSTINYWQAKKRTMDYQKGDDLLDFFDRVPVVVPTFGAYYPTPKAANGHDVDESIQASLDRISGLQRHIEACTKLVVEIAHRRRNLIMLRKLRPDPSSAAAPTIENPSTGTSPAPKGHSDAAALPNSSGSGNRSTRREAVTSGRKLRRTPITN